MPAAQDPAEEEWVTDSEGSLEDVLEALPSNKGSSSNIVQATLNPELLDSVAELKDWGFSATHCAKCGVHNSQIDGMLIQCAKCKMAHYCSMQCFNEDLPSHSQFCKSGTLHSVPSKFLGNSYSKMSMSMPNLDYNHPVSSSGTRTSLEHKKDLGSISELEQAPAATKIIKTERAQRIEDIIEFEDDDDPPPTTEVIEGEEPVDADGFPVFMFLDMEEATDAEQDPNQSAIWLCMEDAQSDMSSMSGEVEDDMTEETVDNFYLCRVEEMEDDSSYCDESSYEEECRQREGSARLPDPYVIEEESTRKTSGKILFQPPPPLEEEPEMPKWPSGELPDPPPPQQERLDLLPVDQDEKKYGWEKPSWASPGSRRLKSVGNGISKAVKSGQAPPWSANHRPLRSVSGGQIGASSASADAVNTQKPAWAKGERPLRKVTKTSSGKKRNSDSFKQKHKARPAWISSRSQLKSTGVWEELQKDRSKAIEVPDAEAGDDNEKKPVTAKLYRRVQRVPTFDKLEHPFLKDVPQEVRDKSVLYRRANRRSKGSTAVAAEDQPVIQSPPKVTKPKVASPDYKPKRSVSENFNQHGTPQSPEVAFLKEVPKGPKRQYGWEKPSWVLSSPLKSNRSTSMGNITYDAGTTRKPASALTTPTLTGSPSSDSEKNIE